MFDSTAVRLQKLKSFDEWLDSITKDKNFEIKENKKFPEEVNSIWKQFSKSIKVAVERDKQYLDWRYIQKPNENYKIAHCYGKENNYLGKGLSVNADATISTDSLKGNFSITNPNYNNSDKSVFVSIKAEEIDKLKDFGYKTNKTGFSLGTNFEYLKDFNLGLSTSSFLEKID